MKRNYLLGETFVTALELNFKDFIIKKETTFEIIEKIDDESYKVYFHCKDNEHEECIQILDVYEIDEIKKSIIC